MKNTKTKKLTFNESNLIAFILIEKMQYSKKELFVNNGQGFNELINDDFVRFSISFHLTDMRIEEYVKVVKTYGRDAVQSIVSNFINSITNWEGVTTIPQLIKKELI